MKRTDISELGEFKLIDRIKSQFKNRQQSTKIGIGDDAALLDYSNSWTVVTTDMLLEGIHFDLSYMPLKHLGYKAVAINVSDIASMNAIPKHLTVSIGVSNRFSVEAIDELYKGINLAAQQYNVDLVGGDTSSSRSGLFLSITALGSVTKQKVVSRNGAKIGDIICVTGDLGGAFLGLQVLEREKQVFLENPAMQPQLQKYDYIVQRQLKPEARMDIIYELAEMNLIPSAMIDVSDGLGSELLHIASQSKVGFQIYEDKLPIDKITYDTGFELGIDSITSAINGGEDYELLFTIKQEDYKKLENHPDIHFIGYVKEKNEGCKMVSKQQNLVDITAQGWQHFK